MSLTGFFFFFKSTNLALNKCGCMVIFVRSWWELYVLYMGAHVSDMTHAMDLIAARATSDSASLMPIPDVEEEVDPFICWD